MLTERCWPAGLKRRDLGKVNSPFYVFSSNIQWNFSGSNNDGSFTTAVSNSFLGP